MARACRGLARRLRARTSCDPGAEYSRPAHHRIVGGAAVHHRGGAGLVERQSIQRHRLHRDRHHTGDNCGAVAGHFDRIGGAVGGSGGRMLLRVRMGLPTLLVRDVDAVLVRRTARPASLPNAGDVRWTLAHHTKLQFRTLDHHRVCRRRDLWRDWGVCARSHHRLGVDRRSRHAGMERVEWRPARRSSFSHARSEDHMKSQFSRFARGAFFAVGIAAAGYASLVAWNRWRYGSPPPLAFDPALDRFIPSPEVAEHHEIAVAAPAEVVLAAAKALQALDLPLVSTIIKLRELALGGEPDRRLHPQGLLDQMVSIGWVVLAEIPGREIVLGAVTKPW